jgi:hypothetical protein
MTKEQAREALREVIGCGMRSTPSLSRTQETQIGPRSLLGPT